MKSTRLHSVLQTKFARSHARAGFTLYELLISLGLFTAIALLATKTFHSSFRTTHGAETAQTQIAQWEQATTMLRRDAWGASKIEVLSSDSATITLPNGVTVLWSISDSHSMQRIATRAGKTNNQMNWVDVGQVSQFEQLGTNELILNSQRKDRMRTKLIMPIATQLMQKVQP